MDLEAQSPTSVLDDNTVVDLLDALVKNKAEIHFSDEFDDGVEAERTLAKMFAASRLGDEEVGSTTISGTNISSQTEGRRASSATATANTGRRRTLAPLEVCRTP